jgi:hypothetical protein
MLLSSDVRQQGSQRRQTEAMKPQVVKDGARASETTSLPLPLAERRRGQKLSGIGVAVSGEGEV